MKAELEKDHEEIMRQKLKLECRLLVNLQRNREIHDCKEFKTPKLQEALPKEDCASKFKNLNSNLEEEDRRAKFESLR